MAISATTSAERSQVWLRALLPVWAPSLRLSIKLVRRAAKAGARLQTAPVANARSRAKVTTLPSMDMESMRGIDSGSSCKVTRIAAAANARPITLETTLNSKPSAADSRTMTVERAPRASRTAYSRRRRIALTRSRPATFKHASKRTIATAKNRVRSNGRTSATAYSRSGLMSPWMWIADIEGGKSRIACLATRSTS